MANIFETVSHLEETDQVAELLRFVQQESHDVEGMHGALFPLLCKGQLRPAFILAMMLANGGRQDHLIATALSSGGIQFDNPIETKRGLEPLFALVDALSEAQKTEFYSKVVESIMIPLLGRALKTKNKEQMWSVMEVLKATTPSMRPVFDWNAPIPTLSRQALCQRGRQQARLIIPKLPPVGTARQRRRVMVAMRETFFMNGQSRPLDFGPRMVAAMTVYGWQADYYPIRASSSVDACQEILEQCHRQNSELLILDDEMFIKAPQLRIELVTLLRKSHPGIKILGYYVDPWIIDKTIMRETPTLLDGILAGDSPADPFWEDPAFTNKVLHVPWPVPTQSIHPRLDLPVTSEMLFFGSVKGFNWHRAFWLPAMERLALPLKKRLSSHLPDGLSALDSFALYMQALSEATCCLNFSMRPNQERVVTFRCFETILGGSLLVQEASPSMHCYFIAGEHYLEFSSLADLAAVSHFIANNREEAEKIRRSGHAFAQEHYRDEKIIGYLDKFLYFPDIPTATVAGVDYRPLLELAHALRSEDRGGNALILYRHILTLDPNHGEALRGCAIIDAAQGEIEKGLDYLLKMKTLSPDQEGLDQDIHALALHAVAPFNACVQSGDLERAAYIIEALSQLQPDNGFIQEQAAKVKTTFFSKLASGAMHSNRVSRRDAKQLMLAALFGA